MSVFDKPKKPRDSEQTPIYDTPKKTAVKAESVELNSGQLRVVKGMLNKDYILTPQHPAYEKIAEFFRSESPSVYRTIVTAMNENKSIRFTCCFVDIAKVEELPEVRKRFEQLTERRWA